MLNMKWLKKEPALNFSIIFVFFSCVCWQSCYNVVNAAIASMLILSSSFYIGQGHFLIPIPQNPMFYFEFVCSISLVVDISVVSIVNSAYINRNRKDLPIKTYCAFDSRLKILNQCILVNCFRNQFFSNT